MRETITNIILQTGDAVYWWEIFHTNSGTVKPYCKALPDNHTCPAVRGDSRCLQEYYTGHTQLPKCFHADNPEILDNVELANDINLSDVLKLVEEQSQNTFEFNTKGWKSQQI